MEIWELIEEREYLTGETTDNYKVIYKKYWKREMDINHPLVYEKKKKVEETIQLISGKEHDSVQVVAEFQVGETYPSIDNILSTLKADYSNVFQALLLHESI
ncbi:hypothetical protein LC040_08475 [Bacillus tianshenii]|nr:hypothetical protein LC040_08475 [Bacillus tianshenii]